VSDIVDVTLDFRTDTPPGKDPDACSPTLRRYHKLLWGRPLPDGRPFDLDDSAPIASCYLKYSTGQSEMWLSSDSIVPTFTRWIRMRPIVSQFDEADNEAFRSIGYTMGGMMLWPIGSKNGLRSINVERGFNSRIADRMDLTLECVRRFYLGEGSPMSAVLEAQTDFFSLFGDFKGFVEHFLFQDLVSADFNAVNVFMAFDDFRGRSVPSDVATYAAYRDSSIAFVRARNRRIVELASSLDLAGDAS
jgi:hypothetical protein